MNTIHLLVGMEKTEHFTSVNEDLGSVPLGYCDDIHKAMTSVCYFNNYANYAALTVNEPVDVVLDRYQTLIEESGALIPANTGVGQYVVFLRVPLYNKLYNEAREAIDETLPDQPMVYGHPYPGQSFSHPTSGVKPQTYGTRSPGPMAGPGFSAGSQRAPQPTHGPSTPPNDFMNNYGHDRSDTITSEVESFVVTKLYSRYRSSMERAQFGYSFEEWLKLRFSSML